MFASGAPDDDGTVLLADEPRSDVWLPLGDDPQVDDWWVPDAMTSGGPVSPADVLPVAGPAGAGGAGWSRGDEELGCEDSAAAVPAGGTSSALDRWSAASLLERLEPGSGLAAVLELLDPELLNPAGPDEGPLDDAALVEAVAAWERLAAWAHLGAALTAAALSRRASMNPHWQSPAPSRTCVAGDELAMRLGWSRPAAHRLVRDGRALQGGLMPVADAVREGLVDTPKLRVLTDRLHDRPYQLSWPVQEAVLPEAPLRTPTQLAADIDRALLATDPEDAALRLPRAIASRHVCHPRRLPDGMAGLWAVLPAADAARVDATLEATARTARAVGDPRTLDQLRADTLTDLATGQALLAGAALTGGGRHEGCAGESDGAGGSAPQQEPDLPFEHETAEQFDQEPDEQGNPGRDPILARPPSRQRAPGIRIPSIRIDVTVALSTLMGLDERPAELAGLGPIPAEQARALAAQGVWRRIVTDPLTGAVLDVGRTRYRPPAALADHVQARDRVCAGPGCSVPADHCDLDHTTEYHGTPANGSTAPGRTRADNLGPLSRRCHRLKTDGGFTLTQTAPGVFEWHTPAGLAYRVTPGDQGRTERLAQRPKVAAGYPDEPRF